jgi:hypothetical protein
MPTQGGTEYTAAATIYGSVRYRTDSAGSSRSLGDIGHAGSFREFAA